MGHAADLRGPRRQYGGLEHAQVVKLLAQDNELFVLAESRDRIANERSMRRRLLKWLWERLKKLSTMKLTRRCTADEARRGTNQGARRMAADRDRMHVPATVRIQNDFEK